MWQTGFFTFKKGAYINECKKKRNCHAGLGNPLQFCSGVTGICHAHYGGISSDGVLYCLGGSLHSLCGIGSEADQPSDKRAQKAAFDLCNGRRLCLCAVCPEISKCDRILQPPNGNRSGSHSLWLDSHGSDRLSGADFSGAFACTWRFDNAGSQYLQYGDCRSCCQLGRL